VNLAVDHPAILLLLTGCVLPLLGRGSRWFGFASLTGVPQDTASHMLDGVLRVLAAAPIAAIVFGLAGLHTGAQTVVRHATGAHVVVALDRSLSMDEPFALRGERTGETLRGERTNETPRGERTNETLRGERTGETPRGERTNETPRGERTTQMLRGERTTETLRQDSVPETKTAAAARLLAAFYARRPHDLFGIVGFSTAPIPVMPLTEHRAAVDAAIGAMRQKALANTEIGAAIAMGLAQFAGDQPGVARVLLLISDGAGAIPEETRAYIRAAVPRTHADLFYLYLRSGDDPPLAENRDDTNDLRRPAGLDGFFRSLGAPYQGFEARDAGAIDAATRRIEALETHPITYTEMLPRRDLNVACYEIAALALLLSLAAQLAERDLRPMPGRRSKQL